MQKIAELHTILTGLLSASTSDLQKILDGDKSYDDLTIGEKQNASKRKKDNTAALALMEAIKSEKRKPTEAEKEILAKYTGEGGLGGIGSDDEYFTSPYIAKDAWGLFGKLDEDAVILDPSAGMGIFAQTRPEGIDLRQIELSDKSAELNSAITDVPMLHGSFEKRSYEFEDNSLDGIITNVPFDDVGPEGLADKSPQFDGIRRIEHYFLLRSMELLKYGKRGVFIVPTGVLDNKSNKLQGYKKKLLQMASFIGGVRLPNKIFSHTGADVAVDILVFEKHREDAYKALHGGLVQYESREAVIFDNEVNRSFIFGNYFDKPLGKKNMIGTKISSKEFSESRFLGETAYPKSAVLTEDDMDTLKVKVAKIFKQAKFSNTTAYDDLILLNNVTILDKLSLEALSEIDKTKAFFRDMDDKIDRGEMLTVGNLKEFKRRYDQFASVAPAGRVVRTLRGVNLYLPLMAINYTSDSGISKTTKDMADALIFTYKSPARVETKELEKQYKSKHLLLKIISDKTYASQFKEKQDSEDKGRVNHQIASILGNATVKLLSNWDMKANEKPQELDFKKFQTLHDILALKGKDNIVNENGGYDYVSFTKGEILEVDDLFLSHNGDIIPQGQIAYDGANYGKTIDYIDSLEYNMGDYGLTEDEFYKKINSMKALIEGKKKTVNINSLKLDHKAILSIADDSDKELIRGVEESIINDMDLLYIKAENITDPNKETIDFPTSIGIVQFYAKGYDYNFKKLWDKYEDKIKAALGVSDYKEALGRIEMARSKVFADGEKQYFMGETVFNKIKPIILGDIRKKRQEFDIKLETEVKLNPIIAAKIKSKLERDATIHAGGEADHERLDYLGKYVHSEILDTNHGFQNEDIRRFSTSMKGTIAQDTGMGKALDDNEVVLTPNGFKRNGDIVVGDFVIGSSGKPIEVLGVYPQGVKDIYEVTFFDNTSVKCTLDHLWTVNERNGNKATRDTYKTIDLKTMLEKPISKDIFDKRYGTTSRSYRYSIPFTPACEFGEDSNLPIDPYLLGLLLGDGGFTHGVPSFTNRHKKIIDKAIKLLPKGLVARILFRGGAYHLNIVSKEKTKRKNKLTNILRELGLWGKYSHEKFIPEIYKNATLKSRKALIQGLIDTDGHVLENGNIEYGSSSKELIEGYKHLALSIGMRLGRTSVKEKPKYTYKDEVRYGKTHYRITSRTQRANNKAITNVKKIGSNNATCIRVDSADALYVAGRGFNLTHNTRSIFLSALSAVITNRAKRALVVVPTAVYDKWAMEIKDGRKDDNGKMIAHPIVNKEGAELISFTQSSTAQKDWAKFCKDSKKRIMVMPHSVFETFKFTEKTQKWIVGTTKQEAREGVEAVDAIPAQIPDFSGRDINHMVKAPARTIGFFEDGDIEFLVIDEGQMAKNSSSGGTSSKFASSILSSRYGVCVRVAQALISRSHGMTGQGVVIATATPFTSSPYEIYTMLKNTGGMNIISDMKDFENTFMEIEKRDEVMATDPEKTTQVKVFEGLKNIQLLNSMGLSQIRYRNAETESQRDVNAGLEEGALKPEYEELQFTTEETEDILDTRTALLDRYEMFKEYKKQYEANEVDDALVEDIASSYGYDVKGNPQHRTEVMRKGSIFSLVHGMNMLSMNKKIALDGIMEFDVSGMEKDKLESLKEKLLKQDVTYPDVEVHVDKNGEEIEKIVNVKVKLSEYIQMRGLKLENDGILSVPEVSENIAKIIIDENKDNADLFDIDEYPKYKMLLENITKELNENSKAKQLVFSISIVGARIIEHFVKHLYSDLKISHKVMNAVNVAKAKKQRGDKVEDDDLGALAQFQEDYNNSMVSTVLIFTTKNSTGVDFNKMTKAVHLVDIPYTPDVWHQAMGRGVRQGNKVKKVNVYQYSTNGTLDVLKLRILSEKGDWQEKLKNADDLNSITSIQSDGEKIIEQALAENKNAGVEDIDRIINEKKSEREAIIKEEQQQRADALKQSVNNANRLQELSMEGDPHEIAKYIRAVDEIKTQERSVNIKESTGKNVLKNIQTNSYSAIQFYLSDKITDRDFIDSLKTAENPQQLIREKLDSFVFTSENISSYSNRYLNRIFKTLELDRTKEYFKISGAYSSYTTSDKEEVQKAKDSGKIVKKLNRLTDNQYMSAMNIIENNINRAKDDIETKLLSIVMAKSIMQEAVAQAIEVVPDDEKELYRGLATGTSVFAYTGKGKTKEIVKIEDTVSLYSKQNSDYIELPNNKMLKASYSLDVEEKTSEFVFDKFATKTSYKASYLNDYYEKLEKQKGKLEAYRSTIERYFNTDISNPSFNKKTLKGIRSFKEYLQVVELIKKLRDFNQFGFWFTDIVSVEISSLFANIKDEIITASGTTIAKIGGVILATSRYATELMIKDVHDEIALDGMYYSSGAFNYPEEGGIDSYNYTLLEKISGKKKDDLKDFILEYKNSFRVQNNVIFPKKAFVKDLEFYLLNKELVNELKDSVKDVPVHELALKSIDELKAYFDNASESERFAFMQEVKDGKIVELGDYRRIIEEANKDTYFQKAGRDGKGILLTEDLELIIYGRRPNQDFKDMLPNGMTPYSVGMKYSKFSRSGYNIEDGKRESVKHGWTITVDNKILDYMN